MRTHYKRIAYALNANEAILQKIIEGYGLFDIDGNDFWSDAVIERLNQRNDKSAKARQSANKRWRDANAMRTQCDGNARKEKKGKKRKEIKVNIVFADFWLMYSKKEGDKKGCESKWNNLKDEERTKIMETLPFFLSKRTMRFTPYPATYLNQRRWEDKLEVTMEEIDTDKLWDDEKDNS